MFTGKACGICHGLHELTQGMDTEWLSFIPDFSLRPSRVGNLASSCSVVFVPEKS